MTAPPTLNIAGGAFGDEPSSGELRGVFAAIADIGVWSAMFAIGPFVASGLRMAMAMTFDIDPSDRADRWWWRVNRPSTIDLVAGLIAAPLLVPYVLR